jgi:hypothetical protein
MNKKLAQAILLIALSGILAACQFSVAGPGGAIGKTGPTPTATIVKPTPTRRPSPTPRPTATVAPTTPPFADVEAAAQAYGDALTKGDAAAAANMLSAYGLMIANKTGGDFEAQFKADGDKARIAGFKILGSEKANDTTVLVHVSYTQGKEAAPKDEVWPFRQENGTWLYNMDNLVDFHTLTVDPQTTNGITFVPLRLLRYSDHTRLELMGQNNTNELVVFGQVNETLANFHFDDQIVKAEKTYLVLNPLRTNMDLALDAKGYFTTYPTSIDIRIWRDYQVKPWFSFVLP